MSSENIPGIYNYCDRWCERCIYTSRCAVADSEKDVKPEEMDMQNKAFWDRLRQNFAKARTFLEQAAEKNGMDLADIEKYADEIERSEQDNRSKAEVNRIIRLAREYGVFGRQWLKTQPGMMEKLEKLKEEISIGTESHDGVKKQTEMIRECLAVIQWYLSFIEAKFMRALMGKYNAEFVLQDLDDTDQRDYDGSAKIAILSIERSILAWANLFELLPQQEDDFLKALSLLEKMKKQAMEEFPDAMKFVRPGFDENLD